MKLLQAAAAALFATTLLSTLAVAHEYPLLSRCNFHAGRNPEANVWFLKYPRPWCEGLDASYGHVVKHGHCTNFDYPFNSFKYEKEAGVLGQPGNDNDTEDCRCYVIAFAERECKGDPFCLGPMVDGYGVCADLQGIAMGQSAMVKCDDWDDESPDSAYGLCSQSAILEWMWGVPPPR